MKKYVISYIILLAGMVLSVQSQNVGISAVSFSPDSHAMLHIWGNGAGVGILIPNMTAATRTGMSPDATDFGLLVYQTDGGSNAGYWYWDGSAWTRLFNGTNNGWSLTGNAGTTPGTHFIGTTDNQDWLIYTNNTQRIEVEKTGEVGINTAAVINTQLSIANSANNGRGIFSEVTGTTGNTSAIFGLNSGNGVGLALRYGLYGSKTGAIANSGYGVYGTATGGAGNNYGACGSANGGNTNYGVCGLVSGATGSNLALYGNNISTGVGTQYGVYGQISDATAGGTGYAVYGNAIGINTTNYGGYFKATNAINNFSLFADTGQFRLGSVGTATSQFINGTVSVNPPSIAGNTSTTFIFTLTGATTTDYLYLTPPSGINSGLVFQGATITAANTVTVHIWNRTAGAIDDAALNWPYIILRP